MSTKQANNAFGTFIFKDSGYLPGLLMVAYKLRRFSSGNARLVCLHTPDVNSRAIEMLNLLYDDVIEVEYLRLGKNRVGRQSPLPFMFTRFRFLQLNTFYRAEKRVKKVLIFDGDMLPTGNYEPLFNLPAPAGVINESKEHIKGASKIKSYVKSWEWHKTYENICKHGEPIPKNITDKPLLSPEENMGINGGLMLFSPSSEDFKLFVDWCERPEIISKINEMYWPDMQAVTAYYSGRWTNVDAKYLGLYGYPNIQSLQGIHFIGPKPWQWKAKGFEYRLANYPDYKLWAYEFIEMCNALPKLLSYKSLLTTRDKISQALQKIND